MSEYIPSNTGLFKKNDRSRQEVIIYNSFIVGTYVVRT